MYVATMELMNVDRIYEDALNVYRILSEDVSEAVKTMGEEALQVSQKTLLYSSPSQKEKIVLGAELNPSFYVTIVLFRTH